LQDAWRCHPESLIIGYDKASKIAHYAADNDLALKEVALKLGMVGAIRMSVSPPRRPPAGPWPLCGRAPIRLARPGGRLPNRAPIEVPQKRFGEKTWTTWTRVGARQTLHFPVWEEVLGAKASYQHYIDISIT
jgi:hypothetical protein